MIRLEDSIVKLLLKDIREQVGETQYKIWEERGWMSYDRFQSIKTREEHIANRIISDYVLHKEERQGT